MTVLRAPARRPSDGSGCSSAARAAVAALLFLAFAAAASAEEDRASKLILQGLEAYAHAQSLQDRDARLASFARAERLFSEAARHSRAGADLYANAGTAALQAERLGPAVLAFRRALAVDPDHTRSKRNLAHARSLLPAWVPKPRDNSVLDTFFFWHRSLSTAERAGAAALLFLLAAIGFAVAIRWQSGVARSLAFLPALAWMGLTLSIAVEASNDESVAAVVIADETLARAADSENAPARFPDPLPGGAEVEVMELRSRWARVRLANDLEAWVSRPSLETVVDPKATP